MLHVSIIRKLSYVQIFLDVANTRDEDTRLVGMYKKRLDPAPLDVAGDFTFLRVPNANAISEVLLRATRVDKTSLQLSSGCPCMQHP